MHTFQINALIQFLTSSACFKPHGFIIRKTVCTHTKNVPYKNCMYKWSSWWWTHEVWNM